MKKLLQVYKQLPLELRYFCWLVCVWLLIYALRSSLPEGNYAALVAGATAFFVTLYLVQKLFVILEKRQGAQLDKEITAQTTGPSRRDLAEMEKEYKQKWLDGLNKLNKAKISLYQLPWYIILGEPGGGKTMTLLNSGMDFPMGKDELPGFGGTRNYNWWFTNTAVLLDTAGRLVFEEEGTSDRQEWEAFLRLLKKRRRCPINGVVIALPANKLMADDAEQRYQNATIIRDRLRQIQSVLDVRFPVFILVTKSDLIAGFTEFFNELDSLQRNQMFGWSRPGEFDAPYDPNEFGENFEELYEQLHNLRLQFLNRATGDVELGWVYTFPEAFRALKERIQDYMQVMFSKNIFSEPLFFRGFYFTSALQEGKPILEVLGQQLSEKDMESLEGIFPQSRAFFIHDFYTEKVAKEEGMVFRSQKHIKRMRFLKGSTLYLGLPMVVLFSLMTFMGYRAYSKTVEPPKQSVMHARTLVQQYRERQEISGVWDLDAVQAGQDLSAAIDRLAELDDAIRQVKNPDGLASLMFASVGQDAEDSIRSLRRELIGYCIVRPEVAQLEAALVSTGNPITPENYLDFGRSLKAYMSMCLIPRVTEDATFSNLRAFINQQPYLNEQSSRYINEFLNDPQTRIDRILTMDDSHHRSVLDKAILKAEQYWLAAANVDTHPSYAWWTDLYRLCEETRRTYDALLAMRQEFRNARTPAQFKRVVEDWRETLPGSQQDPVSSRLLGPLRQHLKFAPRQEDGSITPIRKLIQENEQAGESFWSECMEALPTISRSKNKSYSDELVARIDGIRNKFLKDINSSENRYRAGSEDISDLLTPYPAAMPNPERYDFVADAELVERELERLTKQLGLASIRLTPSMEGWNDHIRELLEEDAYDIVVAKDRNWQPSEFKKLATDISKACRRNKLQRAYDDIKDLLSSSPEFGLASFMEGHDAEARSILRFDSLRSRHAKRFLNRTITSMNKLFKTLQDASEEDLLDNAELSLLLEQSFRQYLQQYINAWASAYESYALGLVTEMETVDSWQAYRRWMRDQGDALWEEYQAHLTAVIDNIIIPANATTSTDLKASQLAAALDRVEWPHGRKLTALRELMPSSSGVTTSDLISTLRNHWRAYRRQLEGTRISNLDDLGNQIPKLPSISTSLKKANFLAQESLTQQLMFVAETGHYLLMRDALMQLYANAVQNYPDQLPFIFETGGFETNDPLKLKSTLADIAKLSVFDDASQLPEKARVWLRNAKQWRDFLSNPVAIEVEYDPIYTEDTTKRATPCEFYSQVALRLPGLSNANGATQKEIVFACDEGFSAKGLSWQPAHGNLWVSLRGPKRGNLALEPRILEISGTDYGLLAMAIHNGRASDNDDRGAWVVELDKDMKTVEGLHDDANANVRRVTINIRFATPGGLPHRLPVPSDSFLQELRPTAP